jgi:serine/threonine protein kinase/tetratricopeptide (TPR) repeat protein
MTSEVSSFGNGRYQVLRKLGEGGKGIVFLCQDTVLRRQVAIKLLKEEGLDTDGLLRFQREVQAMASLVHPNVVTVFDIGQDPSTSPVLSGVERSGQGGRHYLVLELMEGGDVEHLIASAPNQRLDAATTVRIGKEVARALEHAHRHGILHRDVKPGNVWLTTRSTSHALSAAEGSEPALSLPKGQAQGVAKLGDFGLAYLGGSPKLTQAGMMVGSIAYMAPEVALGRPADNRSDLYMLGASLYEMLTGRVPFPGDDPVKVLFAHINDLPLPARRFAADIPEGLEDLVLRLLSKDPEQRPASATDVLRALEEVERHVHVGTTAAVGAQHAAPLQTARPPTPEPRFAQPLVGRERELALLRQRVDAALRGEGSLVFLTGEAGIGKTRLAWEARTYARGRGFLWLEGRYSKEGSTPFQPWVEAVRGFLRTAPPAMLVKALVPYGAELARLAPEVAERLGHVPPPPSIGPEEERLRLYDALAGFFAAISQEQPLALFLDDLHWAPSVDALHHMARNLASDRLLVVGAYRDVELKGQPVLARGILAMNRERLFHNLPLKRLEEPDVAHMIAHTLGQGLSGQVAGLVYQKTEGNPFFVEEVARYLTESGAVTLGARGWELKEAALMQLPDSVKAVVGERLERLGEEAQGILTWAAVAGREFTLPLLQEVTGLEEEKLLEAVDQAEAGRVLVPRPSLGQEAYAFVDNQTRDVLYRGLSTARRRRYHLRVGQAMEKVHARRLDQHYDALAHHFLEGNDLQKALDYVVKAGDRASSIYSWDRAISHYQTALEVLEELEADPYQQAAVLDKLALVTGLGRGRGAAAHLERALALYGALGDNKKAGEVHLKLAPRQGIVEDRAKAHAHSVRAVQLLEPEQGSSELALAYALLGDWAAHGRGSRSSAVPLLEKGLALAEQIGDVAGAVEIARLLGHALVYHEGQIKRGLELFDRSYEEARKTGNLVILSEVATSLSREYVYLRNVAEASRWAGQGQEAARQSGALRWQVGSALALAWVSILRGDAEQARRNLEVAQQAARKGGIELIEANLASLQLVPARVQIFLGDWDQAEMELAKVLDWAEQSHNTTFPLLWAAPVQGWLYLEKGDRASAKTHLGEAAAFCQAAGDNPPELLARALLAQACSKGGELEEAAAHLRRAREIFSLSPDWYGLAAEVRQAEGVLATAQQRWPEAEAAFQQAVEINHRYHLPYYEARSLLEWGEMYLLRHGPNDREKGMQLLDQALEIFQLVQAKKMVEKVLARKEPLRA